jgi:hypothetical protein
MRSIVDKGKKKKKKKKKKKSQVNKIQHHVSACKHNIPPVSACHNVGDLSLEAEKSKSPSRLY